MKLHGTFSYFVTRKPTVEQLNDADPDHVCMMTPEEFDPHKTSPPMRRPKIILSIMMAKWPILGIAPSF
jgi:hypothetical protein